MDPSDHSPVICEPAVSLLQIMLGVVVAGIITASVIIWVAIIIWIIRGFFQ